MPSRDQQFRYTLAVLRSDNGVPVRLDLIAENLSHHREHNVPILDTTLSRDLVHVNSQLLAQDLNSEGVVIAPKHAAVVGAAHARAARRTRGKAAVSAEVAEVEEALNALGRVVADLAIAGGLAFERITLLERRDRSSGVGSAQPSGRIGFEFFFAGEAEIGHAVAVVLEVPRGVVWVKLQLLSADGLGCAGEIDIGAVDKDGTPPGHAADFTGGGSACKRVGLGNGLR